MGGEIPIIDKQGATGTFSATNFEAISKALRRRGSHAKGWQLKLEPTTQMTIAIDPGSVVELGTPGRTP